MARAVSVDELAFAITEEIKQYTDEVQKGIKKEVKSAATKVKKEMKAKSPKDTGDYADGWSRRTSTKGGQIEITIYNKNKPQIAHLLEFGHAKAGGGRVDEVKHMRPAYDKYVPIMNKNIEKIIKNGGG